MQSASEARSRQSPHYAFDALHALPCGCVAAVYRTRPWDVAVVAVEARGPHCINHEHESGRLLGVGSCESDRLSR